MKILVTGASGFVGVPTCRRLLADGHQLVAAVRRDDSFLPLGVRSCRVAPLAPDTDWQPALAGVECVVHLAARAHVMDDCSPDPVAEFRRINRDGTVRLAEQAAQAGVKRFVFVSSIKVNGEFTHPDRPFRGDDPAVATDAYGSSKAEAEAALAEIAGRTGMSAAVLRPPLVHGPGVKGNLAALLKALRAGVPLPLGRIVNRRSLIGADNLADAIAFLVNHSAQGCFLVCDGEDISTPDLIRRIAAAMHRSPCLLPIPSWLLRLAAAALGKGSAYNRLAGSLVVDDTPLRQLGWRPPFTLDQGLERMVEAVGTQARW